MNKKNVVYGLVAMSAIPFCFQLTCEIIQAEETNLPEVKDVEITGDVNEEKTGVDVFSSVDISLTVDNMNDDNFLTDEGLHWSDDTYVEIIQGETTGSMSDPIFWSNTQPSSDIPSFSINHGDSGRIVNVGKTKSGKVLDLIYIVKGTNSEEWEEYSKYKDRETPRGIGFVGEQNLQNTAGNSIVSLISGTSYIEMEYKIVEHNTYNENPVVLSFITTDIDGGQGVQTDLSNLATIIPDNADLSIDEYGIIYDNALPKGNKLNGSKDLPKGGYLGVGFLSHFNYTFYAPSPKRIDDRDSYPFCARYDLFGSSLQAHVSIQNMEHLELNYLNTKNEKIQESKTINGINVQDKVPETPKIDGYEFSHVSFDYQTNHITVLNYIYKQYYRVNINYIDENGNKLKNSNSSTILEGKTILLNPENIEGYETPKSYQTIINKNLEYDFIYKKIEIKEESKPVSNTTPVISSYVQPIVQIPVVSSDTPVNKVQKDKKKENKEEKKSEINWFEKNTGMKVEDQETFFKGLNEVKAMAEKKYANDPNKDDKVNHAMQNAVAFETYHNDKLQKWVNDFKESDQSYRIDDVLKFYYDREKLKLHVDLAHLSTALASTHKQESWYKNVIKYLIGFPHKNPNNTLEINFLLANTLLGDILTTTNIQDERADKDVVILKYHPDYKNLSYEEALWKYYSMPDLDKKRDKLYNDAFMCETETDSNTQLNYALFTFGGLALMVVGHSLYKKNKYKYFNQTNQPKKYKIITPNGELYKGKLENPIQKKVVQLKKKIRNKVKQVNKALNKTSNSKIKVAQPNYNKKIKNPIAQKTKNVVKKIKNYVTSKPKAVKSTNVGKRVANILKKVRQK